jgi:hypothetical protein
MAVIADLTGETISSSYGTLLMVTNTAGIGGSIQTVQDGLGANDSALKLSTTVVGVNGSLGVGLDSPEYVIHAQTADDYVGKFESTDAGASIILEDNGSTTDGNRITVTSDALSVATANVTALTVDSSQRVGIGGVPTSSLLELHGASSEDAIKIVDSTNSYATTIGQGDSYTNIFGDSSNTGMLLGFGTPTTGNAKVTITAAGNVGIGTADIDGPLDIGFNGGSGTDPYRGGFYFKNSHDTANPNRRVKFDQTTATTFAIQTVNTDETTASDGNIVLQPNGGDVGIGTDSPSVLLDLESTSPVIRFTDSDATGTPECEVSGAGGDLILRADRDDEKADSLIKFEVDGSEKARIDSSGSVGIGTDSPATGYALDVNGKAVVRDDFELWNDYCIQDFRKTNGTDRLGWILNRAVTNCQYVWADGLDLLFSTTTTGGTPTEKMRISAAGNIGTANAFHVTNGGSATAGNAFYSPASNEVGISSNGVEAIRVDGSQNVGIGTASPNSYANYTTLTLNHSSADPLDSLGSLLDMEVNGIHIYELAVEATQVTHNVITEHPMVFKTHNTERMRIDSDGRVHVRMYNQYMQNDGTTVAGQIGNASKVNGTTESDLALYSAGGIEFSTGGNSTPKASIDSSGNVILANVQEGDSGLASGTIYKESGFLKIVA